MHLQNKIVFITILVVLVGCSGGSQVVLKDFRTGSDGVNLEFLKNAPPKEVFQDQELVAIVVLENAGATNIEKGVLLVAHETEFFDTVGESLSKREVNLEGKNEFSLQGEKETYEFNYKSKQLRSQSQYHESFIVANLCYPYETVLKTEICIDHDPLNQRIQDQVCKTKPLSYSGQGGPIVITNVDPQFVPRGDYIIPTIEINLRNNGKGNVIDKQLYSEVCGGTRLSDPEVYGVFDVNVTLGGKELECKPKTFDLKDEEDRMRCTFKEGEEEVYQRNVQNFITQLEIELGYGYQETLAQRITIINENN